MIPHWRYLRYVVRHKWFVFVEGLRLGVNPLALIAHDWTKFLPCEWFPYVQSFYGGWAYKDRPRPVVEAFDRAWNHHQKANRHHWQYWVLSNDSGTVYPLPMPDSDLLEMVADWKGAGRAINGRDETREWYAKNRDRMSLHPATRERVESLLAGEPAAGRKETSG